MIRNIANRIIRSLGKSNYTIDSDLSERDIFNIFLSRLWKMIRGIVLKMRVKRSGGVIFLGKNCRISCCHKISLGKTITIGDNVQINALSKKGITIGDNVSILDNTIIECTGVIRELGESLEIGNNVGISQNCFIQVRGKVKIGSDVMLGPGVSIFSENHKYGSTDISMINQGTERLGVIIEDDVWIGARSVILNGVTLKKGCIIAAGSVVNKTYPEYSIIGGVPAKLLKSRISNL
jgi:acetyltransferase-like isoleucine patch superfamily enzyme